MRTQAEAVDQRRRVVRLWLYAIASLVVLMVMVGGATRITDSGLSIVEWRPVTGAIPPLTEADWQIEFEKYKTSSEYQLVNKGLSLGEFKRIYWWEWGHRFLGRVIALAFVLPLLWFQLRGWIESRLKWRLWLIFALGALQGGIGWWMVMSGLAGRADVAPERLAIHLTIACLILVALVWTARTLDPIRFTPPPARRLTLTAMVILTLLLAQIALGALVAGLKAGLVHDTWPRIDGAFIPDSGKLLSLEPAWRNLLDNHLTVQFAHRMLAYGLVLLALLHAADCVRRECRPYRAGAVALACVLMLQAVLGIATLLWHVPSSLALAHQAVAIAALIVATLHAGNLRAASRDRAAAAVALDQEFSEAARLPISDTSVAPERRAESSVR
jgi:cytochrome c oxidase assembly protein subunit 15